MSDIAGKMAEWRKSLWGTGPCPVPSQENFTLTDEEREAINMSRKILVSDPSMNPAQRAEWAITLSRLLDRTGFAQ
jgi:hypothetical protein